MQQNSHTHDIYARVFVLLAVAAQQNRVFGVLVLEMSKYTNRGRSAPCYGLRVAFLYCFSFLSCEGHGGDTQHDLLGLRLAALSLTLLVGEGEEEGPGTLRYLQLEGYKKPWIIL